MNRRLSAAIARAALFQDPYASLNRRHTVRRILEEAFVIHRRGDAPSRRTWVVELLERVGLPPSAADRYHQSDAGSASAGSEMVRIAQTPQLIVMLNPDLTYRQIWLDDRG